MWTTLVTKIKRGIEWTGLYYFDEPYTYRTIELDNAPISSKKVDTFTVSPISVTDEDLKDVKVKKPRKPRAKKATSKKTKKKS